MAEKIEDKKEEAKPVKKSKREIARAKVRAFNKELRKSLSTAIIAAFGFLMALVWRDVITAWVNTISEHSPIQGKLISAILVTMISVIGILVVTKVLSDKEVNEKKK